MLENMVPLPEESAYNLGWRTFLDIGEDAVNPYDNLVETTLHDSWEDGCDTARVMSASFPG